ncbi:hypothetical protein [Atlantibacter hermannii]|uniref:hypothetical protein n=1 Tax=Atlantibacter hermannii TaxID=565 RepID=UPI0028AD9DEB|nr:hypothetical protein [Atlantibacter hermannii]
MAKIQMRRTKTAGQKPTAAQILEGELLVNLPDRKIYTKNDAGGIIELGNPETADKLNVAGNLEAGGATALNGGATIANKANITGAAAELTIGSGNAIPTIKMGVTASKSHQIKGNGNDLEITADRVNITNGKVVLNPGGASEIQGKSNNKIFSDDGAGNVTISASKNGATIGDLEIGSNSNGHNTRNVKLRSPLVNSNNEVIIDANGKVKSSMLDIEYTTPDDVASEYYTKAQSDNKYQSKADTVANNYTKTQTDAAFLKKADASVTYYSKTEADNRFISTAGNLHSDGYILSKAVDGTASTSDTSMKYSGFYRMNQAANALNGLNIHVAHPEKNDASYSRGISFEYGNNGNKAYVYRYDADGDFVKSAKIYTEDDKPTLQELGGGALGGDVTTAYGLTSTGTVRAKQLDATYRASVQRADGTNSPYFRIIKTDVISTDELPTANQSLGNIGFQEGSKTTDPYGGLVRANVSSTVKTTGGAVLYLDARDMSGTVKNRITLDTDSATTSITGAFTSSGTNTLGTTTTGALTSSSVTSNDTITAKSKLVLNSGSDTANGIEIGSLTNATAPYIDFHTDGISTDYNIRLQASGNEFRIIGMNNLTLNAKTVTSIELHDAAASQIKMARGATILRDHNNGDVTLSGGLKTDGISAGDLYLGYNSAGAAYTNSVRLESPMKWKGANELVNSSGKLVGASLDTAYLPLTGGSLSGNIGTSGNVNAGSFTTPGGMTVLGTAQMGVVNASGNVNAGSFTTPGGATIQGLAQLNAVTTTDLVSLTGSLRTRAASNCHVWFENNTGAERALIWADTSNNLNFRSTSGLVQTSMRLDVGGGIWSKNGDISTFSVDATQNCHVWFKNTNGANRAVIFANKDNNLFLQPSGGWVDFSGARLNSIHTITTNSDITAGGGWITTSGRIQGGETWSNGNIVAGNGNAVLASDGNINAPVWEGGWLSIHIENRARAHADERAAAWARQEVASAINAVRFASVTTMPASASNAGYQTTPSGAVQCGMVPNGNSWSIRYKYLQVHFPSTGWVYSKDIWGDA